MDLHHGPSFLKLPHLPGSQSAERLVRHAAYNGPLNSEECPRKAGAASSSFPLTHLTSQCYAQIR